VRFFFDSIGVILRKFYPLGNPGRFKERHQVRCSTEGKMSLSRQQLDRFRQAAREIGADESDDALDRAMGTLELTKKPEPEPKKPADK